LVVVVLVHYLLHMEEMVLIALYREHLHLLPLQPQVAVAVAETHQFQMDKMAVLVEAVLYQQAEVLVEAGILLQQLQAKEIMVVEITPGLIMEAVVVVAQVQLASLELHLFQARAVPEY
jgi:hypothetical protein